ncbi:secondary metabolism biosynthetic enzyme [Penicillium angulare]|uniref:secondary metabolism biosynthetic enzyme n=1 Tax=Penicillium angulare TaxID=116970 RepID=UPI002540D8F9|nr:secondary metabolism biosynthetic enzyme [Penicillium angulare]KAJ5281718.1 secondary metabolism biosynthetic enzyme [Penicillium angulare]
MSKDQQQFTVPDAVQVVDGPGCEQFSYSRLILALVGVPIVVARLLGGGLWITSGLVCALFVPALVLFWTITSRVPIDREGLDADKQPIENYLDFKLDCDRERYRGDQKIPMTQFTEKYFDKMVDFKMDCHEALERRYDWATFAFTPELFKFFLFKMVPDVLLHTKSRDRKQTHEVYDRGNDFYHFSLGDSMTFSSGIISDPHRAESIEEMQRNKMTVVCQKLGLCEGETVLDMGCGWGTFSTFASVEHKARVTGVTLSHNGASAASERLEKHGISSDQSQIHCIDYRDIPTSPRFDKIVCLEMAEHVGIRKLPAFLKQMYNLLEDQGVFFLQIGGLRKRWQFEDLVWGLFMNKYIFPGADASVPLGMYISLVENAGFEVKSVDTIGIHYAATIWRWYDIWKGNEAEVTAKYGARWYRIWLYFLSSATIQARNGGATAYQITLVKSRNRTERVLGVKNQLGVRTNQA